MKITRSFSRKIQVKQYEPIELFCSVEQEIDFPIEMLMQLEKEGKSTDEYVFEKAAQSSELLDTFVQSEVEKSANKFKVVDKQKISDVARDEAEHDTELLIEE